MSLCSAYRNLFKGRPHLTGEDIESKKQFLVEPQLTGPAKWLQVATVEVRKGQTGETPKGLHTGLSVRESW